MDAAIARGWVPMVRVIEARMTGAIRQIAESQRRFDEAVATFKREEKEREQREKDERREKKARRRRLKRLTAAPQPPFMSRKTRKPHRPRRLWRRITRGPPSRGDPDPHKRRRRPLLETGAPEPAEAGIGSDAVGSGSENNRAFFTPQASRCRERAR